MREESERVEEANRQLQAEVSALTRRLNVSEQKLAAAGTSGGGGERKEDSGSPASPVKKSGGRSGGGGAGDKDREGELALRVEHLEDDLREAREENEKRVQDTTQFTQMKKLMQTQSSNIKDLRRRLQKYEPSDAKDDADC